MTYTYDENLVSDLHKDAYGRRPDSWFNLVWKTSSEKDKQQIWNNIKEDLEKELDRERRREMKAIRKYEKLLAASIALGAKSPKDAHRWIVESLGLYKEDLLLGGEYICYMMDLPYSYSRKFNKACKELAEVTEGYNYDEEDH